MGNIGPSRQHYEVMPAPAFGIEAADAWTVPPRDPLPATAAEPTPTPDPGPVPDPDPVPSPPSDQS
ncbi:MAG TPA: hypothetical protein VHS54_01385 [Jatrophihabitans sp.]|jgi:hypothetical protein|nr:hypothetical protein [Jatrophihabitans sp.]